jgi:hypothetical protein
MLTLGFGVWPQPIAAVCGMGISCGSVPACNNNPSLFAPLAGGLSPMTGRPGPLPVAPGQTVDLGV